MDGIQGPSQGKRGVTLSCQRDVGQTLQSDMVEISLWYWAISTQRSYSIVIKTSGPSWGSFCRQGAQVNPYIEQVHMEVLLLLVPAWLLYPVV